MSKPTEDNSAQRPTDPLFSLAEVDRATGELKRALRRGDPDDFRRAVNLLDILTGEARTDALVDDIVAEFRVPEPSSRRVPHLPMAVSPRGPSGPQLPPEGTR